MAKPPTKKDETVEENGNGASKELAEKVVKRIGSLVPKGQQAQVVAQVVSLVQQESFSGPLPHPRHLAQYDEILPGLAERIVCMTESNLDHAQRMQEKALDSDIQDMKIGRLYGFIVLVLLIGAAGVSGYAGMIELAIAFLSVGVAGVVGAFIKGRKK